MSLTPSNSLLAAIRVPTMPAFIPTVSVRKIITKAVRNAYTTFPAMSPDPYPILWSPPYQYTAPLSLSPL